MMRNWRMVIEPTLDDLLTDDVMIAVMRSAGVDAEQIRRRLIEIAERLCLARGLPVPAMREQVAA